MSEDLQQGGSDVPEASECVKDIKKWIKSVHTAHHRQPRGADRWAKEEEYSHIAMTTECLHLKISFLHILTQF